MWSNGFVNPAEFALPPRAGRCRRLILAALLVAIAAIASTRGLLLWWLPLLALPAMIGLSGRRTRPDRLRWSRSDGWRLVWPDGRSVRATLSRWWVGPGALAIGLQFREPAGRRWNVGFGPRDFGSARRRRLLVRLRCGGD